MRVERKDGRAGPRLLPELDRRALPARGPVSSTFGARPDAVIGDDGRVDFKAAEGAVTVSIILGGEIPDRADRLLDW